MTEAETAAERATAAARPGDLLLCQCWHHRIRRQPQRVRGIWGTPQKKKRAPLHPASQVTPGDTTSGPAGAWQRILFSRR